MSRINLFVRACMIACFGVIWLTDALRPLETHQESLFIRKLDDHRLGLRFEFVTRRKEHLRDGNDLHAKRVHQYEVFPQIVAKTIHENVTDLQMTMTRGSWRWGSETLWPSIESGAPGVEVWTQLVNPATDYVLLLRALSGLTCASLDGLQQPALHGYINSNTIYGLLPSETVCTENLSTFIKLLPCRHRAGFGAILKAKTIVESDYYSLSMLVRRTREGLELIQSLSVVLPIKNSLLETLGLSSSGERLSRCQAADESLIVVDSSSGSDKLQPKPSRVTSHSRFAIYDDITKVPDLTGWEDLGVFRTHFGFSTKKWSTGVGELRGTLTTVLQNEREDGKEVRVRHIEFLPWFLRPRLDTLTVKLDGKPIPFEELRTVVKINTTLLRGHPATFVFNLTLPAHGRPVVISYGFDKAFMSFYEFPSDPNRGFDVPSAITTILRDDANREDDDLPSVVKRSTLGVIRRASPALLISLAHPDFSMPFNVITMSSTLFATFLGMLINISVRRRGDRWTHPPRKESRFYRLTRMCKRRKPASSDHVKQE